MKAQQLVGVLGAQVAAGVDSRGAVSVGGVTFDWLVGAEDHWHDPRHEAAVRQVRLAPAPAYETRVRVPSGDAVQRVYGAAGREGNRYVVVDVENASPAPFAIAFVISASSRRATLRLDSNIVHAADRPVLVLPRPPMRWATADRIGATFDIVTGGTARDDAFETVAGREVEAAFVFPVAHRTRLRVALPLDVASNGSLHLDGMADIDAVQRGWTAQLERGMRVELPPPLGDRVDAARASALLEAETADVAPMTIANLEDWGFDREATAAWQRASFADRRRARARAPVADLERRIATATDEDVLRYVRDALLADAKDHVDLLPGFRTAWAGQGIAVHDAPTLAGNVSFAIRWHGERPALLWDAPAGVTLRAPALDPSWSAPGGAGEALLAPWKAA